MSTYNDKTIVWRLITHHIDPEHTLEWSKKTGRLAIGWGRIGDIEAKGYTSPDSISDAINKFYPGIGNAPQGGRCLYNFCYHMQPGDLVILSTGSRRALVMEVKDGYEFKSNPKDAPMEGYQHQRKAKTLPIDPNMLWPCAGSAPKVGSNIRWTLTECIKPIDAATREALFIVGDDYGKTAPNIATDYVSADEVDTSIVYQEGAARQVMVNAYERNPIARRQCIAHYGTRCFICNFDFSEAYGEVGEGFIHVHHLRQLADIGAEYEVNPITDLRPVCPNCHAIIHRRTPPYTIEEVQAMLRLRSS